MISFNGMFDRIDVCVIMCRLDATNAAGKPIPHTSATVNNTCPTCPGTTST